MKNFFAPSLPPSGQTWRGLKGNEKVNKKTHFLRAGVVGDAPAQGGPRDSFDTQAGEHATTHKTQLTGSGHAEPTPNKKTRHRRAQKNGGDLSNKEGKG
ncbi:hypothetical protein EAMG_03511 [Escherichia coli M056]|nr:hypothetical protein EAMG_03511 [Escherichia coli M056]